MSVKDARPRGAPQQTAAVAVARHRVRVSGGAISSSHILDGGARRCMAGRRPGEPVPKCPVCGSGDRFVAFSPGCVTARSVLRPVAGRFTRCRGCGSAYLDPRPSPETIELAYRAYYTHGGLQPHRRPLAICARASPTTIGGRASGTHRRADRARWPAWSARVAPSRAAIVAREIRHLPAKKGGRLLDVGCGSGAFLTHMQALGWQAEGVDPDPAAVASARDAGLRVTNRHAFPTSILSARTAHSTQSRSAT